MIDTKKEQERDELHRAIWAIADELRGAVDGWDFKNYVLGTMFYRYISENQYYFRNRIILTCANAGHEYPVFKRPDGSFELYKDKHGFVLGGLEGSKYSEYELHLEPGAKLFVYTDGVPEATNATNELFGTERMIHALNARLDADPMEVLENMRSAVDGFVLDAEQFDDLTMLCLEYKGNNSKKKG